MDFGPLNVETAPAQPVPVAEVPFEVLAPDAAAALEAVAESVAGHEAEQLPAAAGLDMDFGTFGDAPAAPAETVAESPAPAPAAASDFTFHIEDLTLPPAQVQTQAPAPENDGDLTRFIASTDVPLAPAAEQPAEALPDLGDRTLLVAASGALAAAAFEHAARPQPPVIEPIEPIEPVAPVEPVAAVEPIAAFEPIAAIEPIEPAAPAPVLESTSKTIFEPVIDALSVTQSQPTIGDAPLTDEEMRERGFDPSERRTERIEDEIDDQLLPIFVEEGNELVPQIGEQLRAFAAQGTGGSTPTTLALQRSLHTLKGSARMAGAMALGQLTHSMETRVENALQLPQIPPAIFEGLMSSFDRLTMLMDRLRTYDPSQKESLAIAVQALLDDDRTRRVDALDAGAAAPSVAVPAAAVAAIQAAATASTAATAAAAAKAAADDPRAMLRVRADVVDRLVNEAGEVAIARSRIEGEMRAIKASMKELTENAGRLRAQLREIEIAAESQMQSRIREAEEKHTSFDPLEFDRFTRFQEITRMMAESVNDVGTVQQNLIKNLDDADAALLAQGRLNRDLQNDLMRVRMVPFNNVAERLYRVVRQTAKEVGKRANLDIRGTQTEIDRSVLERMIAPVRASAAQRHRPRPGRPGRAQQGRQGRHRPAPADRAPGRQRVQAGVRGRRRRPQLSGASAPRRLPRLAWRRRRRSCPTRRSPNLFLPPVSRPRRK